MKIPLTKQFRTKVFLVMALVSMLPLFFVSISNFYLVERTRQQNIAELQNLAIENAREKTNKFFNDKMKSLNLVLDTSGDLSSLDPWLRSQVLQTFEYLIDNLQQMVGDVKEIEFIDNKGAELVKRSSSDFSGKQLNNVAGADYFRSAIAGDNYYGQVLFTKEGPEIRLASQIMDKNKKIIGVITAVIDLAQLEEMVSEIKIGNDGFVYLANDKGILIAGSASSGYAKNSDLSNNAFVKDSVSGNYYNGLIDFKTFTDQNGKEVVFSSSLLEKVHWVILSQWPVDDAFKVTSNLLNISMLVMLITIFLVIILAIVFTRQITKPIKILKEGTKKIAEGDLEHQIALKTNDEFEVLGERFNQMISVLKENRKLRDEFVFIAAHELRTPVTAIKGYLSMILDNNFGEVPQAIRDNLDIVNSSNERLVQLVQDLLEVARSEAGKMKIEISPVKISANITQVISELKSLSDKKSIKVDYNDPSGEIMVMADSYKLNEVLVNLIGNAIKYTLTDGGIEIFHKVEGDHLVTHIKDHGIGMSKENMEKLFSKFYRVSTKDTAKIEGTGLGLFICKEIIERMDGKVWAESEEGKGSTFSFSLKITK